MYKTTENIGKIKITDSSITFKATFRLAFIDNLSKENVMSRNEYVILTWNFRVRNIDWNDNIKVYHEMKGCEDVKRTELAQDRMQRLY